MQGQESKRKILEATRRLLANGVPPQLLTARKISTAAGTNLAMINYYFHSKDELLKIAVDSIIAESFPAPAHPDTPTLSPKEQLYAHLLSACSATVQYQTLTRPSIPYLMLQDEISLPLDILPFLRAHFGAAKSEAECRVIAFQIVYTLQLIFYRADDFQQYSGIDITDPIQLQSFLKSQLDLFLGGKSK